jgi:Cu2+-exporting ATPase
LAEELHRRSRGIMTLTSLAVGVAYLYSAAVVFGLAGEVFSGGWPPWWT